MEHDLESAKDDPNLVFGSTVFVVEGDWVGTFTSGGWFGGSSSGVLRPSGIM